MENRVCVACDSNRKLNRLGAGQNLFLARGESRKLHTHCTHMLQHTSYRILFHPTKKKRKSKKKNNREKLEQPLCGHAKSKAKSQPAAEIILWILWPRRWDSFDGRWVGEAVRWCSGAVQPVDTRSHSGP